VERGRFSPNALFGQLARAGDVDQILAGLDG